MQTEKHFFVEYSLTNQVLSCENELERWADCDVKLFTEEHARIFADAAGPLWSVRRYREAGEACKTERLDGHMATVINYMGDGEYLIEDEFYTPERKAETEIGWFD